MSLCSVQSSKSVLFGHRHLQVGGRKEEREKKKTQIISVMEHAEWK